MDYATLDLSGICLADLADLELPVGVALGQPLYRGLPFLLAATGIWRWPPAPTAA